MSKTKLLVDTNVLVDYLSVREPFYHEARLLMVAGYVGEFELWMHSSQMTDLIYILSDGGKKALLPDVLKRLRGLRSFVEVYAVSDKEVDRMLAPSWDDPEDALMFEVALSLHADAIISRNTSDFQNDFQSDLIPILTCQEFFDRYRKAHGVDYEEIEL